MIWPHRLRSSSLRPFIDPQTFSTTSSVRPLFHARRRHSSRFNKARPCENKHAKYTWNTLWLYRGYVGWGLLGHLFDSLASGALVPGKTKAKPAPDPEKTKNKKHAKNTRGDPEKHNETRRYPESKTNTPKTRRNVENKHDRNTTKN